MNIERAKEEIKNTVKAYLAKDEDGNPLIPSVHHMVAYVQDKFHIRP